MGEHWYKNIFDFYTLEGALALNQHLKSREGGRLVVAITELPFKCPVAPLEFVFLAEAFFTEKGIRDKVVTHLKTEDLRQLGDQIPLIIQTMNRVTQPEILHALDHAAEAFGEVQKGDIPKYSLWKAMREINSPEARSAGVLPGVEAGVSAMMKSQMAKLDMGECFMKGPFSNNCFPETDPATIRAAPSGSGPTMP